MTSWDETGLVKHTTIKEDILEMEKFVSVFPLILLFNFQMLALNSYGPPSSPHLASWAAGL